MPNLLRINLDTNKCGVLNTSELNIDLSEYGIENIVKVRSRHHGFIENEYKFIYDRLSGILKINTEKHTIITIDFYSIKQERDLKLDQLLK